MPKNSFLQAIFSGPKFSISPIEKTNKGTLRIGEVVPVFKTMLMGRETLSLNLGHLVRFSPTIVPVMEGYEVTFDAFCVPVTALAYAQRMERDIQDFHNLALNAGDVNNPFCKSILSLRNENALIYGKRSGLDVRGKDSDFFRKGSLGDYLNLPSFKNFRDFVRKWIAQSGLFEGGLYNKFSDNSDHPANTHFDIFDFCARFFLNDARILYTNEDDCITFDASGKGFGIRTYFETVPFPKNDAALSNWLGADYDTLLNHPDDVLGSFFGTLNTSSYNSPADIIFGSAQSFPRFLIDKYPLLASYYGWEVSNPSNPTTFLNRLITKRQHGSLDLNYLDKLYEFYKIDAQSAFEEYFEYIMSVCLFNPDLTLDASAAGVNLWDDNNTLPAVNEKLLDLSYFSAYWKIISDWYINTNIDGDPNEFFIKHAGAVLDPENGKLDLKPFNRRWANDVFTSSVPSAMVTNINIPADGTIPDLREANAYQKLVDILRNTGKRMRDVMYGIRGYKPTAESTDMSQPLGSLHSYIGIQSVLQTSQTTKESPLASYSGIGTDSSRGDYRKIVKVVNNNEATPVIVMVLMSVTQRASYMQGLPRYFAKRSSIYDFAIPQLANIGEQEVLGSELFCDYNNGAALADFDTAIFGFNRRYYDWFFEDNEIHASMRDDEDFWSGARVFSSKPVLNSEFIEINSDKDDLNRIFANLSPEARPIYYNVYFEGAKVVALPRYIQYDL